MDEARAESLDVEEARAADSVVPPGLSARALEWARVRALPWDRPRQAMAFAAGAILAGVVGIDNAYGFDHFTHQWANTAIVWFAALCAFAAAHRALAVATLRPRLASVSAAVLAVTLLVVTVGAGVWQTDNSMTVPVYTEADPARYGDPVYLFLEGRRSSGGGVVRQEVTAVVELVPGRDLAERSPNERCWAVLTTFTNTQDAGRWPWERQRVFAPDAIQVLATVEVTDLSEEWHEVNSRGYTSDNYCGTDWFPGEALWDFPAFGVPVVGRLTVSTIDGPPTTLSITDSKGRVNFIDLQDPGTECAKEEEGPDSNLSSDATHPCSRIYDLEDQAQNDRLFGPDEPWLAEEE